MKNLELRRQYIHQARTSQDRQKELYTLCSRDLLFFLNAFGWTYDPRRTNNPVVPFITYGFQDGVLIDINDYIQNGNDIVMEKSRDMGASWMCLSVFYWRWRFRKYQSFMMVSRKADLVDKSGDPDSLFWKVDFLQKHLPGWMIPDLTRNNMHLHNNENQSTIDGESTTGDVGVGGRRTAILLDEFAKVDEGYKVLEATRDNTKCRIFNSTPEGTGNAYFDIRQKAADKATPMKLLTLHWALHPEKAAGLYWDSSGKKRSPWYDNECLRTANLREIAKELDIDYEASGYQFFDPALLEVQMRKNVRPPDMRGDIDFDSTTCKPNAFLEREDGALRLWTSDTFRLDENGKPPKNKTYVAGCDIGVGSGNSNSTLSVVDAETGEKLAEYANANIKDYEFARFAVALCRWFQCKNDMGAYLIWEANGPGRAFGAQVLEIGYRNIYYREQSDGSVRKKASDFPGWFTTKDNKRVLLGDLRRAESTGEFINRSAEAVEERRHYVHLSSGSIAHSRSVTTEDPTGARDNHGDRVIADALAYRGSKEYLLPTAVQEPEIPEGSFAWRIKQRQAKALRQGNDWW